jgi:hypothetical protein
VTAAGGSRPAITPCQLVLLIGLGLIVFALVIWALLCR